MKLFSAFQQLVVDTGTPVSNMFIGKNISVHVSSQKGYVIGQHLARLVLVLFILTNVVR